MMARDERVVHETADERARQWPHNRHPPPEVARAEDVAAPSGDRGKEPRPEITRRIDRVARVVAERRADRDDESADDDRRNRGRRRRVAPIAEREQYCDEERRADDLIDETARHGTQELLRIGGPDSRCRMRAGHLADAPVE